MPFNFHKLKAEQGKRLSLSHHQHQSQFRLDNQPFVNEDLNPNADHSPSKNRIAKQKKKPFSLSNKEPFLENNRFMNCRNTTSEIKTFERNTISIPPFRIPQRSDLNSVHPKPNDISLTPIPSNPIPSNPISSNPISSNPISSNPIPHQNLERKYNRTRSTSGAEIFESSSPFVYQLIDTSQELENNPEKGRKKPCFEDISTQELEDREVLRRSEAWEYQNKQYWHIHRLEQWINNLPNPVRSANTQESKTCSPNSPLSSEEISFLNSLRDCLPSFSLGNQKTPPASQSIPSSTFTPNQAQNASVPSTSSSNQSQTSNQKRKGSHNHPLSPSLSN